MKSRKDGCGYNERIFAGGFRAKLHMARFKWFQRELQRLQCTPKSVLELGCFDGKLINFLPAEPVRYLGFDANWEGGLDLAKSNWADYPDFSFVQAATPDEMLFADNENFDIAVSMETLEHIPPELLDDYLRAISLRLNGYLFITVPNEKGIIFLAKWLIKKLFSKDAEKYTLHELLNATLGRMDRIPRREHKGFDYAALIDNIRRYYDVIQVSGLPLDHLPCSLSVGISIIAKSK